MVSYRASTKRMAMKRAMLKRKKGLKASVFKKKVGYGISVTRK